MRLERCARPAGVDQLHDAESIGEPDAQRQTFSFRTPVDELRNEVNMRKHRMSGPSVEARRALTRPADTSPPPINQSRALRVGIAVAVVLIVADGLLGWLLASVAPHTISGTVYLLGVIVIAASWGVGLAIMTRLVGSTTWRKIHLNAYGGWLPANPVELVLHAAEARRAADQVSELAQRQAALRRVATLVARGVSPSAVFTAVADEVANALRVENCVLVRYLGDNSCELVAAHDEASLDKIPVGVPFPLEGDNLAAMVLRRGATARMDSHDHAAGPIAAAVRDVGIRSAVGAPIDIDGRLWGAAIIASSGPEPHDPHTEARLADFAELVATAIANAQARDELMASRARIVAAGDEARRRIERDLHDGAQQRLVTLAMRARSLEADLPADGDLKYEIARLAEELTAASEELRRLSHGIHPAVLSNAGLRPALRSLCRGAAMPVELSVNVERRLPESVEVAAYYVVAEALTNAAKHADASLVTVSVDADELQVRLTVADDGVGGANPHGSGLIGLKDRVEALGGRIDIASRGGEGTTLTAEIPRTTV
jgi:signal transduction histidine kinase